jgi:hypothetical protein
MTETKPDTVHRNRHQRAFQPAIREAWERGKPERVSIDRVRHFLREFEFEDRATIKPGDMEIVAPSK